MKTIYSTLLLAAATATFTACHVSDDDYIFSESAAQRLNAAEVKYSNLLTSSQYGWAFEYYPTSDEDNGAILYALKFNADGTVDVAGDPTNGHIIQAETSLWDIILDQGPVLTFSTYNPLIHNWADPEPDGKGYEGDYEFSFVYDETENQDSVINLRGKKRGLKSRLKMIDEDVTPAEYLLDCDALFQKLFPTTQRNYARLVIGDETFRIDDMKSTVAEFYPYGVKDPSFFLKNNSFLLAKYGGSYWLRFCKDFTSKGRLTERVFRYDAEKQEFVGENGNGRILPPHFATLFADGLLKGDVVNYRIGKNSEMGDTFKALWTEAENALKKKSNTLNEVTFSTDNVEGDDCNCTVFIKYKPRTGPAAEMYYKFKMTLDGDNVTLKYVGPCNTGAQTVLTNYPACEALLKGMEGTYTFTNPGAVQFDVNSLKATSVTDAGNAFSMVMKYPAETSATN